MKRSVREQTETEMEMECAETLEKKQQGTQGLDFSAVLSGGARMRRSPRRKMKTGYDVLNCS